MASLQSPALRIRVARCVGLTFILGLALGTMSAPAADDDSASHSTRSSHASNSTKSSSSSVEAKLDQILKNQEKIFQRFDEVMEELKIVKIRATLK